MFNKNFATNPTSLKLRRVNEPGRRQKVYKYMRIYLWSALRNMVLRMKGGVNELILDSAPPTAGKCWFGRLAFAAEAVASILRGTTKDKSAE